MIKKKGFTLVETIVSTVIIGIIMYAVMAIFITANVKGANVGIFAVAQSLGEGKMEEAMARDFGSLASEDQANFTGDLKPYSYKIVANYVSAAALDLPVTFVTDYKKIAVIVSHPQLGSPVTLESIRANY
ncbi:MAG: type II secretion system GspH family protein [Candidatus Margulisbacteria bacterium]|nr:type II secretion system GspH family protein [Candidatus Margulisiibacteriota bacterium]